MLRFIGTIDGRIDAKGRAFLPASFRKELQQSGSSRLVLRKDVFEACLVLYPEGTWNARMDEMRQRLSRWDARQQMLFRQFVKNAEVVELDSNGRFLIPRRYLDMVALKHEARFIGMGDTVEVWPGEDREFLDSSEFASAIESLMAPGSEGQNNLEP